ILGNKSLYKSILNSREERAQDILNLMQKANFRCSILIVMMQLCSISGTYPQCLTLQHVQYSTKAVAAGRFGEIWKGYFGDKHVCLKVPKLYQDMQIDHLLKNSMREAIMWSDLKHPNLLPFYRIYQLNDHYNWVCLVSPWMDNGNISDYLKSNPEVPWLPLVSVKIDTMDTVADNPTYFLPDS
ncbi:hypothetical protein P691DRAFT_681926, partial [Macrolepiota fuliginosa MF-IS2]